MNYGVLRKDLDATLTGACPIVASYGGGDRSLRGAAAKLESALTRVDVPHDVQEYPGASHSFLNTSKPPWFAEKVLGVTHDPVASADTWRRVEEFFGEKLATPQV